MSDEWIAPTITGAIALTTAIIAGIVAIRNRKRGALEQRAPDVTEAWAEAERARRKAFVLEDLFYALRGAFKAYARRMALLFDDDAALNDSERAVLEKEPPSMDSATKK